MGILSRSYLSQHTLHTYLGFIGFISFENTLHCPLSIVIQIAVGVLVGGNALITFPSSSMYNEYKRYNTCSSY